MVKEGGIDSYSFDLNEGNKEQKDLGDKLEIQDQIRKKRKTE